MCTCRFAHLSVQVCVLAKAHERDLVLSLVWQSFPRNACRHVHVYVYMCGYIMSKMCRQLENVEAACQST